MNASDNSNHVKIESDVARITVKNVPFFRNDPDLWFLQKESQFVTSRITSESTKFHTIVGVIETEILAQVNDIVKRPPHENQYTTLKKAILNIYAESEEKRLKKLLIGMELGDRKPSHLLREMKDLAGTQVSDELLKSLWMQRLPQQAQAILSISTEDLSKQAALADKICEVTQNHSENFAVSSSSNLERQVEILSQRMDNFFNKNFRSRSQTPSTRGFRSKSRNRSQSKNTKKHDLCWYHFKFQNNAKKCQQPCKFKSEN